MQNRRPLTKEETEHLVKQLPRMIANGALEALRQGKLEQWMAEWSASGKADLSEMPEGDSEPA
jgi:hypothetical protein